MFRYTSAKIAMFFPAPAPAATHPDAAVALAEAAVKQSPGDSSLWLALGEAYGERARTASLIARLPFAKKCKAAFEKAVELDPSNVQARSALFEYCLEAPPIAGGSIPLARAQAAEIAKRSRCRGHLAYASLAARDEDLPREESELRLALEAAAGPEEVADSKCRLALYYEKLGRKPEAIDVLREVLRLRPDHSEARDALKRLGG